MVTIYQYTSTELRRLTLKEFAAALHSEEGVFWVDLQDPNDAEEETIMVSLLDLHPLAIEDCQKGKDEDGHLPKVEDFGDYLFVIFNPVESSPRGEGRSSTVEIRTTQLSAVLGRRLLMTHHYRPQPSITNTASLLAKNPQLLGRGPDFLFHMIIDDVVDRYNPILDALDQAVDDLEEDVFGSPGQDTMERILMIKKSIMTIRRLSVYQREMLYRLSRGEFSLITHDEMIYYRNVYDHLVRMTDLAESYRDMTAGLLDAYLSVTSNRLNQVMKVLTIISTIFLPLSVITGFFGMNFKYLPAAEWEYGVLATTAVMLLVAGGMLWVFRRRRWL
jgi:magnesium transporter